MVIKKFKLIGFLIFCLLFSFVPLKGQEVLKVLTIGNSFSTDAVEAYLDDLAKAAGKRLIVGNMYIGGASLQTHWETVAGNKSGYSYRKITDGDTVVYSSRTLLFGLQNEKWDIITFQQGSAYAGLYDSYFPYLTDLFNYVKNNVLNSQVKYGMHQTWAYPSYSTLSAFTWYDKNQMKMYTETVDAVNRAATQIGIDFIVPVGTAIQNGRSSLLGDSFNRDGNHLSLGLGRFTAACTWFEKLFNENVVDNPYIPDDVSRTEALIAKNAAHLAIQKPFEVTSMAHFEAAPAELLKNKILIDFGSTSSSFPWNNVTAVDGSIIDLVDEKKISTGIGLKIDDSFGGVDLSGPQQTSTLMGVPASASSDSFWGNGAYIVSSKSEPTGGFVLSNMDTTQYFDFEFFSSFSTSDSKNRETYFKVTGDTQKTGSINAVNNLSGTVVINHIKPKPDGTIRVEVGPGELNNQLFKLYYLNAISISPSTSSDVSVIRTGKIKLYPVPAGDKIFIESVQAVTSVHIFDINGRKLISRFNLSESAIELNLDVLNSGYYILEADGLRIPFTKM